MMPFRQGIESGMAHTLDLVALQARAGAAAISQATPQVRILDVYTLGAVSWRHWIESKRLIVDR